MKKEEEDTNTAGRLPSITSDPMSSTSGSSEKPFAQNTSKALLPLNLTQLQSGATHVSRTSIFDKNNRMGILLEEPEPPYLVFFIDNESSKARLSFISVESMFAVPPGSLSEC